MAEKSTLRDTYLSFVIGNEYFAVPVAKVLKVLERQAISQVPNAPAYIRGVINFRGEIISVIRTHYKFALPDPADDARFVIIALELQRGADTLVLGALADRVKDVIRIAPEQIKPVPKVDTNFNTQFLTGIYQTDERFLLLLDVDKVFSNTELGAINQLSTLKEKL